MPEAIQYSPPDLEGQPILGAGEVDDQVINKDDEFSQMDRRDLDELQELYDRYSRTEGADSEELTRRQNRVAELTKETEQIALMLAKEKRSHQIQEVLRIGDPAHFDPERTTPVTPEERARAQKIRDELKTEGFTIEGERSDMWVNAYSTSDPRGRRQTLLRDYMDADHGEYHPSTINRSSGKLKCSSLEEATLRLEHIRDRQQKLADLQQRLKEAAEQAK